MFDVFFLLLNKEINQIVRLYFNKQFEALNLIFLCNI